MHRRQVVSCGTPPNMSSRTSSNWMPLSMSHYFFLSSLSFTHNTHIYIHMHISYDHITLRQLGHMLRDPSKPPVPLLYSTAKSDSRSLLSRLVNDIDTSDIETADFLRSKHAHTDNAHTNTHPIHKHLIHTYTHTLWMDGWMDGWTCLCGKVVSFIGKRG